MKQPKLIVTDIDGIWTDSGRYYGGGSELKKVNTYDALGVRAPSYIQQVASEIYSKKGGEGVFRKFVEDILNIQTIDDIKAFFSLQIFDNDYNQ